jgi:predicted transposase/invertase (TIGR01784 family)
MSQLLNPRVDFVFKKIFGTEDNKDVLMGLLNAILLPEDQVADITLKNPYTVKNLHKDKLSIFDIRAVDFHGRQFSIEMQITSELNYEKRALFLWSKLYSEQLKTGKSYDSLKKSISIHLLNFNLLDDADYHNTYAVLNLNSKKRAFKDLQIHTVEIKKFEAQHTDGEKITTALDRWITFLTRADEMSRKGIPEEMAQDPLIIKALKTLESTALNEEEQEVYRTHWQWRMMEEESIKAAEFKGLKKGVKNAQEAIIKQMVSKGLSITEIASLTGLSELEVESLTLP